MEDIRFDARIARAYLGESSGMLRTRIRERVVRGPNSRDNDRQVLRRVHRNFPPSPWDCWINATIAQGTAVALPHPQHTPFRPELNQEKR